MCSPPSTTGLSRASASRLVSRSPWSRSTMSGPTLTGTTSRSKCPCAQAAWARVWERRPKASVSARESPRRCAMRSAATYWLGMSISQEGGRGVPASALPARAAVPSGTRLIASTPHAIPTPIASAAISPATRCAACCAEPHCASSVRQPAVCGSPACSQAVLVTLFDCSPAWVTQPPATCSTSAGAMPARSISAVCTPPRISAACTPDSTPPRLPTGVRTASTITAVPIAHLRHPWSNQN